MKKHLRTCGHCARCSRCMFSHAGVICRNYKPATAGDDIVIDKAFADDAPATAPAEERVRLVDYLDKTIPAEDPAPESVGVLDITKKNFFVLDREGGFYGGARTLQGAKHIVGKLLAPVYNPGYVHLNIYRAEDTVETETCIDWLVVLGRVPKDGAVPVDDAVPADESLEDNGFVLLSCWGNNTNSFYDPERSYNGGGYWQPSGGVLFDVGGRLVVVEYDKFDCGDFGCRRSYAVECDGFRWAWSESNMDGDRYDDRDEIYNSISGVLGVDADWFLDVARDAVQFAASATWDGRDDGAESAV